MLGIKNISVWTTWLVITFFYVFQYVLRVLPSNIINDFFENFQIQATDIGIFSSVYYFGYAGIHIPLGIWINKYGTKNVISLSALISSLGILPLIFTNSWILVVVGRLFVGAGSAGAALGLFTIVSTEFPKKYFATIIGISVTIGLIGAVFAGAPMCSLMKIIGWKKTLIWVFVAGGILSLLIYISAPKHEANKTSISTKDGLKLLVSNKKIILISVAGGLLLGTLEGFSDAWGVEFFRAVYQYSHVKAASIPQTVYIGMIFGLLILPILAEKIKSYFNAIMICAAVISASFFVILYLNCSYIHLQILIFILGFVSAYQTLIIYLSANSVPEEYKSLSMAFTNMIMMIFGTIFHVSISKAMDIFWNGEIVNNAPVYSKQVYIYAVLIIPIASIIAIPLLYIAKKQRIANKLRR